MLGALGHFHNGVKVHHALVEPIGVAPQYGHGRIGPRIQLAAQERSVNLWGGVAGDKLRVFEIDKVGEKSPGDIRDVTDGLGADAQAGFRSKFFEIVETEFLGRVDGLVAGGFRRAEIDKLVEIVEHAAFAHDVQRYHAAAHGPDGKPVGASVAEHVVGGFAPAAAIHVFEHQRGISRNMLAQKGYQSALTRRSPVPAGDVLTITVTVLP